MPLSQDVSNTQTGSAVNSVDQPKVNIRSGAISANQKQVPSTQSKPDVKGSSWQNLYNFIQNSDALETDKTYDEFVGTYSNDEAALRKLYTTVQLNTDFNSPFQSKTWNEFKENEYNNYYGYQSAPQTRQEGAADVLSPTPVIPEQKPVEEIVSDASLVADEIQGGGRTQGDVDRDRPVKQKPISYLDLYNSVTPAQKNQAFSEFNEFVRSSNVSNVKAPDKDNIFLSYDTKGVFGNSLISPSSTPPTTVLDNGTRQNEEDLFDKKLAAYTGLPLDVVQAKKGEWALYSKMASSQEAGNEEDFLLDNEVSIRDRYAEQEINKKAGEIKDEYYQKASVASNGNPQVYWTQYSKAIQEGFLTENDWQIKKYLDEQTALSQKQDRTTDDEIRLKQLNNLIDQHKGIDLGEKLFTEDGSFVANKNIKFERPSEVADKIEKYSYLYEHTDKGKLTSSRDNAFFQYVYAKRQYDQAVKAYNESGDALMVNPITGNPDDAVATLATMRNYMEDRFANFYSINRMILLNSDPGTETKDTFSTGVVEGLKESLDIISSSVGANADRAITSIQNLGYELTEEQENKIANGFWENAGRAVGQSIPASIEIGANIFLGNKIAGVAGIPRLAKLICGTNKYKQLATTMVLDSIVQGAAFSIADQSAVGGVGEAIGQNLATNVLRKLGLKNEALGFVTRWVTGGLTETVAEVSGQMIDSWEDNGFDWQKASKEVFGETGDSAAEMVATTFIVSLMLGVGGSSQESEWFTSKNRDVWSVFLKEAQDYVNASDSKSPIVKEAQKINLNTPITEEEIAKKDAIIEKKNNGEELTEEEIAESEMIATKEDVQKGFDPGGVEIEFDVTGIKPVEEKKQSKAEQKGTKVVGNAIVETPTTVVKATEKKASEKPVKQVEKKPASTKLYVGSSYFYNGKEVTVNGIVSDVNGKVNSISVTDAEGKESVIVNIFKNPEAFDSRFTGITKQPVTNDNKNKTRVSSKKQGGEKPVEEKKQSKAEQKGTKVVGNAIVETPTTVVKATEKKAPSRKTATKTTVKSEKVEAKPAPVVEVKAPEMKFSKPEGFTTALKNLGYSDSDISSMTIEQQQDIAIKKTEKPIVENTTKVDSVKENIKQEKIAEAQKKIDEQIAEDAKVEVKEEPVKESRKIPNRKTTTRKTATKVDVVKEAPKVEAPKVETKKEENVAKEKPVTKTPDPVVEPVVTEGTTGTEDTGRTEQPATEVESGKSGNKKVRTSVDKGDSAKPVEQPRQKQLTKEQNESVASMPEDKVEKLKQKLGITSKTKSGKQVQREFAKKGGDINDFIAAIDEVSVEDVSDYAQKRAEFDTVFNKAESLRKQGKTKEAIAEYENAKSILPDQSERIDTIIDVASSEVVDVKKEKEKEKEAKEDEFVKVETEALNQLESIRKSLVDNEVTAKSKKKTAKGNVLSVNRTTTDNEYEILIDNGDGKTASKAIYNSETGASTLIEQNKTEQIANKTNFENSKERKTGTKKKSQSKYAEDLTDEVLDISDRSKSDIALGRKTGTLNKAFSELINKIAYGKVEKATTQYISDLKSELNGLIGDSSSIGDVKVKRKIMSMINSLSEKKQDVKKEVISEEEAALKAAEAIEKKEAKKEKKENEKNIEVESVVKKSNSGNKSFDSVFDSLESVRSRINSGDINLKTDLLPLWKKIEKLLSDGKITEDQSLELKEIYRNVQKEFNSFNKKKELTDIDNEFDKINFHNINEDDYGDGFPGDFGQSQKPTPSPIGSSGTSSYARISIKTTSQAKSTSILKKIINKYVLSNKSKKRPSIDKMKKDLIDSVKTLVFSGGTGKNGWLGVFKSSENVIILKSLKDLDTFIHEVGHAISFKFGLSDAVKFGTFDSELSKLWDHGSAPPLSIKTGETKIVDGKKTSKRRKTTEKERIDYKRQEGLAEFIRAYSLNPDAARALYPGLTKLYEENVDNNVKNAVFEFGDQMAVLDKLTVEDQIDLIYNPQSRITEWLKGERTISKSVKKIKSTFKDKRFRSGDKSGRFKLGWLSNLHTAVFESYNALGSTIRFVEKKTGKLRPGANPYMLLRLMSNYVQNRFKSLVETGLVDKNGTIVVDPDTGRVMNFSWLNEFMDTSSKKNLDASIERVERYLIVKNIDYEIKNGRVSIIGDFIGTKLPAEVITNYIQELEALKENNPDIHYAITESARRYQAMALQSVKYRYETGLITKKRFDEISENQENWVSLKRDLEEIRTDEGYGFRNKKSGRLSSKLHSRSGSESKIENPYASLMAEVMDAYYEGDNNVGVKAFVDAIRKLPSGEVFNSHMDGLKEVQWMEDGELKRVWVTEDMAYALEAISDKDGMSGVFGSIANFIFKIINIPRPFITSTISFFNKNVTRDTIHRMLGSRYKTSLKEDVYLMPKEALSDLNKRVQINILERKRKKGNITDAETERLNNLEKEIAKSMSKQLELYGGNMSGWYFNSSKTYYEVVNELKDQLISKDKNTLVWAAGALNPKVLYKKYMKLLSQGENINRFAEYRKVYNIEYNSIYKDLIEEGMSETEAKLKANWHANIAAAYEAKDLMDFTISGTKMTYITKAFMFLNPSLQGWSRNLKLIFEGNKSNRQKGALGIIARLAIYSTIATIFERAFSYSNDDDDELRSLDTYQRDTFWNFKYAPDSWLRIPKPFEFGLLSSSQSRLWDYLSTDMSLKEAFKGFDQTLLDTAFPLNIKGFLDNPIAQLYTNRDEFRDVDIVPFYEQNLGMEFRNIGNSSEIGKMLHGFLGLDARQYDQFFKKSFSNWGNLFLSATDAALSDEKDMGDLFSKRDFGVFSNSPFKNSIPYRELEEMADYYGVRYNSKEYDHLSSISDKYKNAESSEDKDRYAKEFREESVRIKEKWDSIIEKDKDLHSIGGATKYSEEKEKKQEESWISKTRKNKRRNNKR